MLGLSLAQGLFCGLLSMVVFATPASLVFAKKQAPGQRKASVERRSAEKPTKRGVTRGKGPKMQREEFLRRNLIRHRRAGIGILYRKGAVYGNSRNLSSIFHRGTDAHDLARDSQALRKPATLLLGIGLVTFVAGGAFAMMPLINARLGNGWLIAGAVVGSVGAVTALVSLFPMVESYRILERAIKQHNKVVLQEALHYPNPTNYQKEASTRQPGPHRASHHPLAPPHTARAKILLDVSL